MLEAFFIKIEVESRHLPVGPNDVGFEIDLRSDGLRRVTLTHKQPASMSVDGRTYSLWQFPKGRGDNILTGVYVETDDQGFFLSMLDGYRDYVEELVEKRAKERLDKSASESLRANRAAMDELKSRLDQDMLLNVAAAEESAAKAERGRIASLPWWRRAVGRI